MARMPKMIIELELGSLQPLIKAARLVGDLREDLPWRDEPDQIAELILEATKHVQAKEQTDE